MILRLRHAVPWLQKFSGWSVCAVPPPLACRFSGTAWASATLAPSANDSESPPDLGDGLPPSVAAEPPEKKKRRSTRAAKATAAVKDAETQALSDGAGGAGEADGAAASSSSQSTASKQRASSRRKAATAASSDPAEPAGEPSAPPAPAKRTRRKKQEEAPAAEADADAESRRSSGAEASSSGSGEAAPAAEKRASRSKSKKAVATTTTTSAVDEGARGEERVSIRDLPYEDCLVLPRKAEQVLVALGLRSPLKDADTDDGADAAAAAGPAAPSSIGSVLELASYLGRPDPKELATPLLIAQYQGYLGPSPDYLYDLFYLDYDPPYLTSDAVRGAAVAAARSVSRAAGLLSAKGSPPEALARAAMDGLRADVADVSAQEARAPRLTEAQLELFLLDWASARLAGPRHEGGIPYLALRCAALQLTRPIVVERLHRYAVQGDSLQDLAAGTGTGGGGGGRGVRLSQPMEALIEGLKAGVRLEPERLMQDFRLTSPGSPLYEHLGAIRRAVVREAVLSLDPGGAMYHSTLMTKLHAHPDIGPALKQQETQWKEEQGERDGSALTHAQVRLLFHLWRLECFRAEEQVRRQRQAESAGATA
ncbi:hypothetical protein PLESTB_001466900 [Pleodorina starrii]|uniref:Uncharacterized protein n=1 Tax=Pleodorina starrii TaxID=330485 RepID=A0A9W6BVM6_9CHLO|nr:hypothetical protein PLESTM_001685100 [Pleodorina starrii]GLC59254.1 hypothetical protein PLESTB_001466900 [Pleodorina starrii]GLC74819.1 hypothetical protein PLESTF_001559500 [Pleodorina starrii]